jgi:LysR family transcriptional regulator, mexEF-oprN operon transcriptional activator
VLVSFAGDFRGDIDGALEKLGRSRRVALAVPQFGILPALLRGTDLIATVPDYAADALAAQAGLRSEKLPFKSPTFDLGMAWRAAADRDPAETWFRQNLVAALRDKVAVLP